MRKVFGGPNPEGEFSYGTRPFSIPSFKPDTFIPLALYGSYWYDEQFEIVRFCGENEIDPELKAEILKDSPHYYIIGIVFNYRYSIQTLVIFQKIRDMDIKPVNDILFTGNNTRT